MLDLLSDIWRPSQVVVGDKIIEYVVSDVDGVLTDGGYYCDAQGLQFKKFHCNDSVALRLMAKAGLSIVLVTSASEESFQITARRVKGIPNLKLLHCAFGSKYEDARHEVVFRRAVVIGDCVDDIPMLKAAGLSFCPADAIDEVKLHAGVLKRRGGEGCLLEVAMCLGLGIDA